jgi:hypothetical protein
MDIINTSIFNLDKQLQKNIKSLQYEYQKAILDTSKYYFNLYSDFDNSLKSCFTELQNIPEILPENYKYNPIMIIEFDNNRKPSKILREGDWNKDMGYLQNRKIIYDIDLIQVSKDELIESTKFIDNTDITSLDNLFSNRLWNIIYPEQINLIHGMAKITANRFWNSLNSNNQIINQFRKFKLRVDNYLNIESSICINGYSTENIYFCFNKISFPDLAFTSNKKLNKLIITEFNNVINVQNKNIIFSKDKENDILDKSKYFIPNNYGEVYTYFDNFRKLATWYNTEVKEHKNKIICLEQQVNLDKEKIENLETELKQKNELLNNYKNLVS